MGIAVYLISGDGELALINSGQRNEFLCAGGLLRCS